MTHLLLPNMDAHEEEEALVHALENYHAVVVSDKSVLNKFMVLSDHLHELDVARVVPHEGLSDEVMHRLILQQATDAQAAIRAARRERS